MPAILIPLTANRTLTVNYHRVAPPPPPKVDRAYGAVTIGGKPAPEGTLVVAVDPQGKEWMRDTTGHTYKWGYEPSWYDMILRNSPRWVGDPFASLHAQCSYVTFYVNGVNTGVTVETEDLASNRVDLSV